MLVFFSASVVVGFLSGCETVANVAQGVADKARSSSADSKQEPPENKPAANQPPCATNFLAEGNAFTGKLMKSSAPLQKLNPDAAYKKVYGEIAKRGWQITTADKDTKIILAAQQVNFSSSGRVTPMSFTVQPVAPNSSNLQFTYTMAGGTYISESAVRDLFCKLIDDVQA